MTYEEALAFIHGAYGVGEKKGLTNMREMLNRLGNPQERFPTVHVTGTNGKGSVCAFVHAALRCAGLRTGLYTSPFLQRYNERMRVNGVPIADETLADITARVAEVVGALRAESVRPTEFEIGTAIAFCYFAEAKVDIAVIEVGLGGRLDPTNVIVPQVTAIASIGLDHMRVLGDTKEAIAREKAGIAKHGVPMVLSAQADEAVREVVRACCDAVGAPFSIAEPTELPLGLAGAHQRYNAGVAVAVLEGLRGLGWAVTDEHIRDGLLRVIWPGRLEWIAGEPPLLMDGAHNPQGVQALCEYVGTLAPGRNTLLCGMLADKDWQRMAASFAAFADEVVTVAPDTKRSLRADALAEAFGALGVSAVAAPSLPEALNMAREKAGPYGRVIAAGSLYLIGSLRTLVADGDDTLLSEE